MIKCYSEKCEKMLSRQQEKGGQKYCSRSCSNSAKPRLSSNVSREKVSKSLSGKTKAVYVEKQCLICAQIFSVRFGKRKNETCSIECGHFLKAKRVAESRKINGTDPGWAIRTKEPSYPEKYFISLFENENITGWQREKKVGRWFIDFAFCDKMLALEIDGRQHDEPDRKASDEVKDQYLVSLGWKVFRIKWYNPVNQAGKNLLYPQIKQFLELC